jgi:hypothetical protein
MMKRLFVVYLLLFPQASNAQEAVKPRPSPLAVVTSRYKDTYFKITYSQPHKQGREVFGNLVPYGQVWRTGANEATEITATRDIKINGLDLRAGTYSIFTIPEKDKWTIIVNADVGLWGAYNYNPKTDVLRFDVPSVALTDVVYEPFTIWIDQKNDKADWTMAWDKTKVMIALQYPEPKP